MGGPLGSIKNFLGDPWEVQRVAGSRDFEAAYSGTEHAPCVFPAYKSRRASGCVASSYILVARTKYGTAMIVIVDKKIPIVNMIGFKLFFFFMAHTISINSSAEFSIFIKYDAASVPAAPTIAGAVTESNGNAYVEGNVIPDAGVLENQNPIEMIRAMEKPLRDRESILLSKNRDFYTVLTAAVRRDEERQRAEALQRKDGLVAKSRLERGMGYGGGEDMGYDGATKTKIHLKGSKIGEGVPIILVPSAFSTLITIYNVKEFLEDGVYIPTDVKLKQMNGQKPECVTVQKKFSRDRVVTAYEVRDKPSALKTEDWDRVVAVFVLGKEWQFKDWPFKDHVEIFNKVIGFYLRFEDDSVESAKTVKQWNVKIISVSKNKRHQDRAAALEVWDKLEEFMRSRSR
nr:protein CDC73 homolog [Ipomoea batatas]